MWLRKAIHCKWMTIWQTDKCAARNISIDKTTLGLTDWRYAAVDTIHLIWVLMVWIRKAAVCECMLEQESKHIVSKCTRHVYLERGEMLRKLTLLECPLQSEDFRLGCVFIGASWQEEAGTRSRITEQQWNVVQQGISWVKHKAVLGF